MTSMTYKARRTGKLRNVASGVCASVVATMMLAGPTQAQETTEAGQKVGGIAIDDIVVTARRKEERLQDVPIAVTALAGDALARNSVLRLEDLSRAVPALQIAPSAFSASTPRFTIRSQSQFEPLLTLDPSVAVYFGDVVQARAHGLNAALYDLESVQVLKGPQGTLFGRNTTGGAVLIVPKAPSDRLEGGLAVNVGNYDLRSFEGMVNLPISEAIAVRAAGKITRRDGYTPNLFTGDRFDDERTESWRVSVLVTPADWFRNTLVLSGFHASENGTARQITALRPSSTADIAWPTARNFLAAQKQADFHSFSSEMPGGASRVRTFSLANTTDVNVGGITIKNILGYRKVKSSSPFDFDGTPLRIFPSTETLDADQISNEFQLLGNAFDNKLDWIMGAYYFREAGEEIQIATLDFPGFFLQNSVDSGRVVNISKSAFAQGTYRFGFLEGLSFTGGIRYTKDTRRLTGSGTNNGICTVTADSAGKIPLSPCSRTVQESFSSPTYTVSLDYKIDAERLAYIVHRRGYRSGGFNLRARLPNQFVPFDPEYVQDFEIGLKADWRIGATQLRTNIAAYHQNYSGIQRTQGAIINNTLTTTVVNAAKAKVNGVEVDATWAFGRHLELRAYYARSSAHYTDWKVPLAAGGFRDQSDFKFSYAPLNTAGGSARAGFDLPGDAGEIALQGDVYYQSRIHIADVNVVPEGVIPGYTTANARLEWNRLFGMDLSAALWMRNVTKAKYYTSGTTIGSLGTTVLTVGAPRTVGLELRYAFGR